MALFLKISVRKIYLKIDCHTKNNSCTQFGHAELCVCGVGVVLVVCGGGGVVHCGGMWGAGV